MCEVVHAQKQNPLNDLRKLCMMVGISCTITYAKFGDDQLRGLRVAGCQILPFPIDFDRRPYDTLALTCECV